MKLKSFFQSWQNRFYRSELEELVRIQKLSRSLASKASLNGSAAKLSSGQLSPISHRQLSSVDLVKRLIQVLPWEEKADACNADFARVFFAVTSISRPWKAWVLELNEPAIKKVLNELLRAFIQTAKARAMSLEARVAAINYQQELLKRWLETPPSFPKGDKVTLNLRYRGVEYRRNVQEELITLSAQARHYADKIKILAIEPSREKLAHTVKETTAAEALKLIKQSLFCPEEVFAHAVLETAVMIREKVYRIFVLEQNLGDLTSEEFTEILKERSRVFQALHYCNQRSIDAYLAQQASTARIVGLAEEMLTRIGVAAKN